MPSLDFHAIKLQISLRDVLDKIGWSAVRSKDGQYRGPCPLHISKRPRSDSFAVNGDGWYCHRCKVGGDQLRLWAMYNRMEIVPATLALCRAMKVAAYYLPRAARYARTRNGEEER